MVLKECLWNTVIQLCRKPSRRSNSAANSLSSGPGFLNQPLTAEIGGLYWRSLLGVNIHVCNTQVVVFKLSDSAPATDDKY